MAHCEFSSASHERETPTPKGVTAPSPVTTTRRLGAGGGAPNESVEKPRATDEDVALRSIFDEIEVVSPLCGAHKVEGCKS